MSTHDVISLHCIQNEFLLQRGRSCKQRDIRDFMKVGSKAKKSDEQHSDSQPRLLNAAIQNASVQPTDVLSVMFCQMAS